VKDKVNSVLKNMDKNKEAKIKHIKSFHNKADRQIDFLTCLYQENHRQEALTLCLCYIDSFSQWLCYPSTENGKNFVHAIVEFGGNPIMGLVHPIQAIRLRERLRSFSQSMQPIVSKIEEVFPGPGFELLSIDDFLKNLDSKLTSHEADKLKSECWRATLAATVYYFLRNPFIHNFGGFEISFSNTTYQGEIIKGIGFIDLHDIVKRLHHELRRRSETTNQWLGNDEIVGD